MPAPSDLVHQAIALAAQLSATIDAATGGVLPDWAVQILPYTLLALAAVLGIKLLSGVLRAAVIAVVVGGAAFLLYGQLSA